MVQKSLTNKFVAGGHACRLTGCAQVGLVRESCRFLDWNVHGLRWFGWLLLLLLLCSVWPGRSAGQGARLLPKGLQGGVGPLGVKRWGKNVSMSWTHREGWVRGGW